MVVVELSDGQVEETIRDLLRCVVLLDRGSAGSDDPIHRHACLHQSRRLKELAKELEERRVGR